LAEGLHPVFERGGFLLTNFFLIDSGYVLMRVYGGSVAGGRISAGDFFAKRFLRVWPAHIIMGLSLVALVVAGTAIGVGPRAPEWFAWDQLPAQLGLVQAFGIPGGYGWNAPSWSISALIGCYLAFPWILKGLSRVGPWTALALGAEGMNMGTRFIATKEAPVHENVKQALVAASELDTRLVMRPLRNTERVLKNAGVEKLLAKEKALGSAIKFEDIIEEVAGIYPKVMIDGDMDAGAWSCGMVAGLIYDIPTCKELIDRIMAEAEDIITKRLAGFLKN
jgi:peptidoglycan/LPS O-acetylase OafA/YrhL